MAYCLDQERGRGRRVLLVRSHDASVIWLTTALSVEDGLSSHDNMMVRVMWNLLEEDAVTLWKRGKLLDSQHSRGERLELLILLIQCFRRSKRLQIL